MNTLNGTTPEFFNDRRIIFMSLFNDINWAKKGNTEIGMDNAEEVVAFATQFKPGHWCFFWTGNSNEP